MEDIESLKKTIINQIDELNKSLRKINEMKGDINTLSEALSIKILALPKQKMYRLKNSEMRTFYRSTLIRYDSDLSKSIYDFIEEVSVEAISISSRYAVDDYRVEYKTTGYMGDNNKYENEDFGKHIFFSKEDLANHFDIEKMKSDFISNQEASKKARAQQLQEELNRLNSNQDE